MRHCARFESSMYVQCLFSPQVNLFGIVTIIGEFLSSGGIDPFYRIEPVSLLAYFTPVMLFQFVCQGAFLVGVAMMAVKESRHMYRQKRRYFYEPWNWCEVSDLFHRSRNGSDIFPDVHNVHLNNHAY